MWVGLGSEWEVEVVKASQVCGHMTTGPAINPPGFTVISVPGLFFYLYTGIIRMLQGTTVAPITLFLATFAFGGQQCRHESHAF